jgi:hypothetical protein
MRRRLLRPALLIPAFVLLALGAGIAYAAWTQLDAGRIDANEEVLASLPRYPGSTEVDRLTQTEADGTLPIPDEVVTSILYAPPAAATQAEVVEFYVSRLTPEWRARTTSVTVADQEQAATGASAFRVDFSRGEDCVRLLTYGMAKGHFGRRTFALAAESGEGPCDEP